VTCNGENRKSGGSIERLQRKWLKSEKENMAALGGANISLKAKRLMLATCAAK